MEHQTGTSDPAFDLVGVLYHALQSVETNMRNIAGAERRGDSELVDFLRNVQQNNREVAEQAKRPLRGRLGG